MECKWAFLLMRLVSHISKMALWVLLIIESRETNQVSLLLLLSTMEEGTMLHDSFLWVQVRNTVRLIKINTWAPYLSTTDIFFASIFFFLSRACILNFRGILMSFLSGPSLITSKSMGNFSPRDLWHWRRTQNPKRQRGLLARYVSVRPGSLLFVFVDLFCLYGSDKIRGDLLARQWTKWCNPSV